MQFTLDKKTVFILSSERWGIMKLSKHHYAIELAERGNTVYFIEPPDLSAKGITVEMIEGSGSLYLVKYKPLYRGERFLPAGIYRWLIKAQVRRIVKFIGTRPDVLWCFYPYLFQDLNWFDAKVKILHMMDNSTNSFLPPEAGTADICFGVTDSLVKYLQPSGKPVYFINHGLSKKFISEASILSSPGRLPDNASRISVGYVGNLLMEAIDKETMLQVIHDHPEVDFIFWGQYKIGQDKLGSFNFPEAHRFVQDLQNAPNVVLKGPVTPESLSKEIRSVDLFWLCYKKGTGNLWEGANSHKILEYLITGKPVITHKMETYEQYEDILYMVKDMHNKNYPMLFDRIVNDLEYYSSEKLQKKRVEMAIGNSYENQIKYIESKISEIGLYR